MNLAQNCVRWCHLIIVEYLYNFQRKMSDIDFFGLYYIEKGI